MFLFLLIEPSIVQSGGSLEIWNFSSRPTGRTNGLPRLQPTVVHVRPFLMIYPRLLGGQHYMQVFPSLKKNTSKAWVNGSRKKRFEFYGPSIVILLSSLIKSNWIGKGGSVGFVFSCVFCLMPSIHLTAQTLSHKFAFFTMRGFLSANIARTRPNLDRIAFNNVNTRRTSMSVELPSLGVGEEDSGICGLGNFE